MLAFNSFRCAGGRVQPVILIGNGCRYNPELIEVLCSLSIPVMTTWMAIDLVPEDCPVYVGRPGIIGQRAANKICQKSDLFMAFGARMDNEQVGYNYANFAPNARKVVYDIDPLELAKLPSDWARRVFDLSVGIPDIKIEVNRQWMNWCKDLYNKYPVVLPEYGEDNPYRLIEILSELADETDVIVNSTSGLTPNVLLQAWKVKKGQRITNLSTLGPMGADIPMAIGASLASKRRVICVTGDGGFMLNIQELEVVLRESLNIKFIVFNNGGYGTIRNTQLSKFGRKIGCDAESGLTLPHLTDIADLFRLDYCFLSSPYKEQLKNILNRPGAAIIEYFAPIDFERSPKVASHLENGRMAIDAFDDMTPKVNYD
jgi:acetolactate synthase I/II/III large subunit